MKLNLFLNMNVVILCGLTFSVTLIYNACGEYQAAKNASQSLGSEGDITPDDLYVHQREIFEGQKIQLDASDQQTIASFVKARSSDQVLSASIQSELSELNMELVYFNECLADKISEGNTEDLLLDLDVIDKMKSEELEVQSYSITGDQLRITKDLDQVAKNDECLLGLKRNQIIEVISPINVTDGEEVSIENEGNVSTQASLTYTNVWRELVNMRAVTLYPQYSWRHLFNLYAVNTLKTQIVAVIDSGVNTSHSELKGQLWRGRSGEYGYNSRINSKKTEDIQDGAGGIGHGTAVAGIIAAKFNKKGIAGVAAKAAKIMTVKVFGPNGYATSADVVNGIRFATASGADVINLSLGGSSFESSERAAIRDAVRAGIFVSIAAGNSPQIKPMYPARHALDIQGAMAVGATYGTGSAGQKETSFSARGAEIYTDGTNIRSLSKNGGTATASGTSFSAPLIAGTAALVLAYEEGRGKRVSPSALESRFISTGIKRRSRYGGIFKASWSHKVLQYGWSGTYPSGPTPTPVVNRPIEDGESSSSDKKCYAYDYNKKRVITPNWSPKANSSEPQCRRWARDTKRRFERYGSPTTGNRHARGDDGSDRSTGKKCYGRNPSGRVLTPHWSPKANSSELQCRRWARDTKRAFVGYR